MNEMRARTVVDGLRTRGVDAQMARPGVYQFGVTVALGDGREAVWDTDGVEAQILRNGVLVGYVPVIDGSAEFDESQVIQAIAATDYNAPIGTRLTKPIVPMAPLPPTGGVFRRFLDGFRYR